MPINVGIDLVSTDEIRESVRVHGSRYLERIYTDVELQECRAKPRLLAGRFAAKEATMKALGRHDEPIPWRSIGVRSNSSGELSLELTGAAAALADRREVAKLTLSITHRRTDAAAIVLAELDTAR